MNPLYFAALEAGKTPISTARIPTNVSKARMLNLTNMKTAYTEQAEQFLATHGLTFRATLVDTKTPPWEDDGRYRPHYRVTITRPARFHFIPFVKYPDKAREMQLDIKTTKAHARIAISQHLKGMPSEYASQCITRIQKAPWQKHSRITFDFFASIRDGETGAPLSPYVVLSCISGDATCPETFSEFCADYGYSEDSRKAYALWKRCNAFAKRLRRFFTTDEINALQEIQ